MNTPDTAELAPAKRRPRGTTLAIAVVILWVLTAATVWLYQSFYLGVPFLDEWHCSKGNAPIMTRDGGRDCLANGSALSAGETWDQLGNRPYSCDGRRGWIVIHRDQESDCLRDGRELPAGWSISTSE
jgi:hypothetical protein